MAALPGLKLFFVLAICGIGIFFESSEAVVAKTPEIYSLHITSDIKYRFSTTLVTSRVKNADVNQSREAIFDVTLPNEAFITNFTLEIEGKIVVGEVKEKEEASQQYADAVARGESAGFVGTKQRKTNKFNLKVTVAPQSKVTFNLTYEELLKRQLGRYEQVIYIDPGQPVEDMSITVSLIESREITELSVPPLRKNDILTEDEEGTNELAVITRPSSHSALIKYFPSIADQTRTSKQGISAQFLVRYDIDRDLDAGDILVVNGYFVHFFAPRGYDPIPKDVLFILDTSGSMQGTKMGQLKTAMNTILDQLHEGDRINVMKFSGTTSRWQDEMLKASEENVDAAKDYVGSIRAGGWTNINAALTEGIRFMSGQQRDPREARSPVLVFLTDGEATTGVTESPSILRNVRGLNGGEIPIFTLAFGQHADFDLVKKIAIQNNGLGRKIYDASDAAMQITGFYDEIAITLLRNITFKYLDAPVRNVTKNKFQNYFEGSEVIVCGRLDEEPEQTDVVLGGETRTLSYEVSSNSVEGRVVLHMANEIDGVEFSEIANLTGTGDYERITEKVWAYLTIKQLLEKELATANTEEKETIRQQVLKLSLRYGFVTPLTAMVVTKATETEDDIVPFLAEDGVSPRFSDAVPQSVPVVSGLNRPVPKRSKIMMARVPSLHTPGRYFFSHVAYDMIGRASPSRFPQRTLPRRRNDRQHDRRQKHRGRGGGGAVMNTHAPRKIGKARRRNKNKLNTKTVAVGLPLKVKLNGIPTQFCFKLLDSTNLNSRTDNYLLYANDDIGVRVTTEINQPSLTKGQSTATISAIYIHTANNNVTIRHHLVDGGDNCTTNQPWTHQWSLQCPGGLQVNSDGGNLTVQQDQFRLTVKHFQIAGGSSSQLLVSADESTLAGGNGGILSDIMSKNVTMKRKIRENKGRFSFSGGHFRAVLKTLKNSPPMDDQCWVPASGHHLFQGLQTYVV